MNSRYMRSTKRTENTVSNEELEHDCLCDKQWRHPIKNRPCHESQRKRSYGKPSRMTSENECVGCCCCRRFLFFFSTKKSNPIPSFTWWGWNLLSDVRRSELFVSFWGVFFSSVSLTFSRSGCRSPVSSCRLHSSSHPDTRDAPRRSINSIAAVKKNELAVAPRCSQFPLPPTFLCVFFSFPSFHQSVATYFLFRNEIEHQPNLF